MKNVPKSHHYVTRAYMKRFSNDIVHVYALFKNNNKKIVIPNMPTGVENLCAETDFYTVLDECGMKNTNVESILASYEDSLKEVFNLIRPNLIYPYCDGGVFLNGRENIRMIDAVAVQFVRGKFVRKTGLAIIDRHFDDLFEETRIKLKGKKNAASELEYLKRNRELIKQNALAEGPLVEMFINWQESLLRKSVQNRKCHLVVNMTDIDFVSSDEPVLICKEIKDDGIIRWSAISDPDSCIYYPLDSKHLIMLGPLENYTGTAGTASTIKTLGTGCERMVLGMNVAQFVQCDRTLISQKRETLERIADIATLKYGYR